MKVPAAVFALALAGSVAAQGGPELPTCAVRPVPSPFRSL